MQQIAYQGYQAPQQISQAPMPALFPTFPSCTPLPPKARFHVRYDDFRKICDYDDPSADVLRYIQLRTDWLIASLRKRHGIAEDHLPHVDDLWFSASYRDIEEGICHTQSHTTCGRTLRDVSAEDEPRSLIERGFVERRFIARPGPDVAERPATTFFEDNEGIFIIVDRWGNYTDVWGEQYNAVDEGYALEWQYRYNIEKVNAALAGPWHDPPEPMPRWGPLTKRRDPQMGDAPAEITRLSAGNVSKDISQISSAVQGGSENAADESYESSTIHDSMDSSTLAMIQTQNGLNILTSHQPSQPVVNFCKAPWEPETLIGLSRARHTPGLFEITGDDEDHEAAEWLIEETRSTGDGPAQAWECIERHIAWMTEDNSPSWWVRERGQRSAVTLRHVVGWDKKTNKLNGRNWRDAQIKANEAAWYPERRTPYTGPPVEPDAMAQASPPVVEVPLIVKEAASAPEPKPVRVRGMLPSYADKLMTQILSCYPGLSVHIVPVGSCYHVVRLEYAPGTWIDFANPGEWQRSSKEIRQLIAQAAGPGASEETEQTHYATIQLSTPASTGDDRRRAREPDHRDDTGVPDDALQLRDSP